MQINIEKRHLLLVLGALCLLTGTLVYAYGGSSPSVVGHSSGELQPPTVTTYEWSASTGGEYRNMGSVGSHDACFLTKVRLHDDDHDSRLQGCEIHNSGGEWIKYVEGHGGTSYCKAICLNW